MNQIIQMKHKKVKNTNWQEANQLAIYKHGLGLEHGTSKNLITLKMSRPVVMLNF